MSKPTLQTWARAVQRAIGHFIAADFENKGNEIVKRLEDLLHVARPMAGLKESPTYSSFPRGAWEPLTPDKGYWHFQPVACPVVLYGAFMHIDAISVVYKEDGTQLAKVSSYQQDLDDLYALVEPSGPFETINIDGEEAVPFITPYGK
jgi:hypothetical protein